MFHFGICFGAMVAWADVGFMSLAEVNSKDDALFVHPTAAQTLRLKIFYLFNSLGEILPGGWPLPSPIWAWGPGAQPLMATLDSNLIHVSLKYGIKPGSSQL